MTFVLGVNDRANLEQICHASTQYGAPVAALAEKTAMEWIDIHVLARMGLVELRMMGGAVFTAAQVPSSGQFADRDTRSVRITDEGHEYLEAAR